MKNTIRLTLALALFCGIALADDGNQGTGGRTCDPLTDPTCHSAPIQSGDENDLTGDITIDVVITGVIENSTLFLLG